MEGSSPIYSKRHLSRIIKAKVNLNLKRFRLSGVAPENSEEPPANCLSEPNTSEAVLGISEAADSAVQFIPSKKQSKSEIPTSDSNNVSEHLPTYEYSSEELPNSESSEDESISDEDFKPNISHDIRQWCVQNHIAQNAVSQLLTILRKHSQFQHLPKDFRTLLKTPRITVVRKVSPGEYCHFGLLTGIQNALHSVVDEVKEVSVQINIDGIPISKSSGGQFWPILGCVLQEQQEVFIIGLYYGDRKPDSVDEFLSEFVNEYLNILQNGYVIVQDSKRLKININCFICDAPARAYITAIKGHGGFFGCGKYETEGEYFDHRVIFPELTAKLRDDDSFRRNADDGHHTGVSPLQKLPIDLVMHFPFEYMHLVCLGVVRKLIKLWMRGDFRLFRLSSREIEIASNKLLKLKIFICAEFARKPRSLRDIDRWKATELRQFLLYTGPVVLYKVLPKEHYELFLALSVSISILANRNTCQRLNDYANDLLVYFVKHFEKLYGRKNLSYNVHGLIHLSADVKHFGPLDTFSAFKFENYLGYIKRLLKKPNNPIQQVHRRLAEYESLRSNHPRRVSKDINYAQPHTNGPLVSQNDGFSQFRCMYYNEFKIVNDTANSTCLLNDGEIIRVHNIVTKNSDGYIVGSVLDKVKPMFLNPCDSSVFNMYIVNSNQNAKLRLYPISSVQKKCVLLPVKDEKYAVIPLLHSDQCD